MADASSEPAMSRQEFSVAYHGAERSDDHTIDVQLLAPALLAFGKLLKEANWEFNNKKSTTKVLVVSDFEHKCFNINFELIVGLFQQLRSIVDTDSVKDAKEVLEWLGLLMVPKLSTLTYLSYLRWKKGRKVEATPLSDADDRGLVVVKVEGEGSTVTINNHIYNLSRNAAALRATKDALAPLGQDGFERMEVGTEWDDDVSIGLEEANEIIASCNQGIEESKELDPKVDTTTAWLSVYSPVYDPSATMWRFKLGREVIYADISATRIAQEAIDRGGAMVEDSYQVKLEITVPVDAKGNEKEPEYKVLEVLTFVPAGPPPTQGRLL